MSPKVRRLLLSLLVPVTLFVGGALFVRETGFDAAGLRALLALMGCWSAPAFIALFVTGLLMNLPGIAFLVAARLAFGPLMGFAVAYVGAILAVTAGFALARFVLPQVPPKAHRFAFVRRAFEQLEARPIRTVALLRLVMLLSPPLHYALALTPIRTRDYVLGSALGLAIPVAVIVCVSGGLS